MNAIKTNTYPRIKDYAGAYALCKKDTPYFAGNNKKHSEVSLREGDVVFTYHDTELVRYHPDGRVRVTGHHSISSVSFIRVLTPPNVGFYALGRNYYLALGQPSLTQKSVGSYSYEQHDQRAYLMSKSLTIRPMQGDVNFYELAQDPETIRFPRVIQGKATRIMRESGFNDFRDWLHAAVALMVRPDISLEAIKAAHERFGYISASVVARALKDPSQWPQLMTLGAYEHLGRTDFKERVLTMIRRAVYQHYDLIETIEMPYVSMWNGLKNLRSAQLQYPWAV